ncbi:MAG TPA: glycogen debranching protein GlgX [Opitutaceae bacterium]|nr:glycogen debranching protein GlgX [Opitutaceae bacterium]
MSDSALAELASPIHGQPYQTGVPFPQGATWDGKGVNFSVFSEGSDAVELCLFNQADQPKESERIRFRERTNGVWHIYIPGLKPGQLYGYRAHGPYEPDKGRRFNPHKLLLDPYAKAIGRELKWDDSLFGYQIGHPDGDLSFDERDSAAFAPLGMVIDTAFDWTGEQRPKIAWHETVIYEAHVRGMTRLHPDVPEEQRGTYAGLASDPILRHLQELGVTAIELMPLHHFLQEKHLLDRGLSNYWGYNTLSYFAPEPAYAADRRRPGNVLREFKEMVKRLHNAGFEVILDVVYNHTAEGNQAGPTLSYRGLDNLAYYRTVADQPRYYMDYTGCGNTLNMVHPHSLQLLMDSLRYWVTEMHVDGFRFDLAAALARELKDVDQLGAFFDTIYQDPTLAAAKLIAEPWDLGEGGYQVGKFPPGWAEWNGKYRDTVRKFWKGEMGLHSEVATRLGGSSDLYEHTGRLPSAGINFVTAHDGFTLRDLVTYDHKHNEANKEENKDGTDDNNSWNCGQEGETQDPAVIELRERQKRNLWCTLLFAQGVPMICGGDELSRTQQGNNNAYCQDNELSWSHWDLDERARAFLDFARRVVRFRREHANFRRRSFYEKDPAAGIHPDSVRWFRSDGKPMSAQDWEDGGWMRTIGMFLAGDAPEIRTADGGPLRDADFLLLLNAHHETVEFRAPASLAPNSWEVVFDTAQPDPNAARRTVRKSRKLPLAGRSFVMLAGKTYAG